MKKECHYLAAFAGNDSIVGVLPLVRLKSFLFGDFLVSVPFFNYGGSIADSSEIRAKLFNETEDLGALLGVDHIETRELTLVPNWPGRTDKVAMILELPETEDELAKSLGSKRRSQIRRPLREDPTTRKGGSELLDEFYAVFCRNMRDLGTPVYSKSMFRELVGRFSENCEIIVIDIGGVPAAAAFLIHANGTTEIPWASTVREFNPVSINMLLYWEALRSALAAGSKQFDFGRSTIDAGTYRFKKQWGAKPLQFHWHYWLPNDAEMPGLNPGSGKFDIAINMWKRMPLWLTRLIGPSIVKHLP
jgi:FemAB-related protein (PEP-CTERM system-associated)